MFMQYNNELIEGGNLKVIPQQPQDKSENKDIIEQHALKNVNNCLNTNIYSCLETSGGKSSNPYLNVVQFFNTSVY